MVLLLTIMHWAGWVLGIASLAIAGWSYGVVALMAVSWGCLSVEKRLAPTRAIDPGPAWVLPAIAILHLLILAALYVMAYRSLQ